MDEKPLLEYAPASTPGAKSRWQPLVYGVLVMLPLAGIAFGISDEGTGSPLGLQLLHPWTWIAHTLLINFSGFVAGAVPLWLALAQYPIYGMVASLPPRGSRGRRWLAVALIVLHAAAAVVAVMIGP